MMAEEADPLRPPAVPLFEARNVVREKNALTSAGITLLVLKVTDLMNSGVAA